MTHFSNKKRVVLAALTAATCLGSSGVALAQAAPAAPAAAAAPADADAGIVVLGTRRTDRTSTSSASPIDIISTKELATQGASNLIDIVKNVVPSFFAPQNTISDASSFVHSPSLRGLPADETLVMINGKRLTRSALVQVYSGGDTGLGYGSQGSDIGSIPAIALKSLEVLRDGATAQYGSDAIAGVMNYGLRDNDHGVEVQGRYGQFYRNGDGKSYQLAANAGFKLGDNGFANLSGEYDSDGQTSRGVTRAQALAYIAQNPGNAGALPYYPLPAQVFGNSPSHGWKVALNSGMDISDSAKLYVVANASHSHTEESFNYRSSTDAVLDPTGTTLQSSYAMGDVVECARSFLNYNPTPGKDANGCSTTQDPYFHNLYPAGFTPVFVGVVEELFGVAGIKGTAGKLTYDVSVSASKNTLALSMYNSLNTAFSPNNVVVNPVTDGPYKTNTQTSFNFGKTSQKETNANIDLTYPVEVGFAKPVTLSGGFEYRKETYVLGVSEFQAYAQGGASGYGGVSPSQAGSWSQSNVAFYAGAETDITNNWTVGTAGRYEHYDTFGSATVGKINTRYEFIPGFAIRGTVGTGFHAPSPGQAHNSTLTTTFIGGTSIQAGTFPIDSVISQDYGAKPLTPEKSTNFGVGFTAKPTRGLSLTVDYYNIKVRNRIFVSQPFPIVDATHPDGTITQADITAHPELAAVGVGGTVSYFTNGLNTLTQGVDLVAAYNTPLSGGNLNLTLAYNHNNNKVSSAQANVINGAQASVIEHLAPHDTAHFSANFTRSKWSLTVRENYYGSWSDANDYGNSAGTTSPNGGPLQVFGAKATTDLDVTYNFASQFALTLGANNLFNTFPDKLNKNSQTILPITGGGTDGQVYPRSGGPFGINGGFWYVRATVKY
jgi:iron complex outermembrane receptor protein